MEKLYGLDLFSGIGGITLGLSRWVTPVAYCENDRHAQAILLSRMSEGKLPLAPIWDDVRTLDGASLPRPVDIIYGGFPCQDISIAGHGVGLAGKRSGLFFEILRLAEEIKPQFVFLENVPAIATRGCESVGRALAALGYDLRWYTLSAASVGAEFQGYRWFALASARGPRLQGIHEEIRQINLQPSSPFISRDFSQAVPDILRKGHGIPHALDRIECLGNSVVPAQVEKAFASLLFGAY